MYLDIFIQSDVLLELVSLAAKFSRPELIQPVVKLYLSADDLTCAPHLYLNLVCDSDSIILTDVKKLFIFCVSEKWGKANNYISPEESHVRTDILADTKMQVRYFKRAY